jgi:hypothetical protein
MRKTEQKRKNSLNRILNKKRIQFMETNSMKLKFKSLIRL